MLVKAGGIGLGEFGFKYLPKWPGSREDLWPFLLPEGRKLA